MKKKAKLKVYENHPADCRIKDMGNVCQTIGAGAGTVGGGKNLPIVLLLTKATETSQDVFHAQ